MHQVIEATYTGLTRRLRLTSWMQVPRELVCMALASIYSEREIKEALGFYVTSEAMYWSFMWQIADTVTETKNRFKITGLQAA